MYINHPVIGVFDENCEFVVEGITGEKRVNIYAMVDIAPGQELFVSYSQTDDPGGYFEGRDKPLSKEDVELSILETLKGIGTMTSNLRYSTSKFHPQLEKLVDLALKGVEQKRNLKREKNKLHYLKMKMKNK